MKRPSAAAGDTLDSNEKSTSSATDAPAVVDDNTVAGTKRPRVNDLDTVLDTLQHLQQRLFDLDDQCAKEQVAIQQKYAKIMAPHIAERQSLISKIPHFWGKVLSYLPLDEYYFCEEDKEFLKLLTEIHVEDNLDTNGSFCIRFRFGEGHADYLSPDTITYTTFFSGPASADRPPKIEISQVNWTAKADKIVEAVRARRAKREQTAYEQNKNDGGQPDDFFDIEFSFIEWLRDDETSGSSALPPLAELIRQDMWQNPLSFFEEAEREEIRGANNNDPNSSESGGDDDGGGEEENGEYDDEEGNEDPAVETH